jgi:hypothetical protein
MFECLIDLHIRRGLCIFQHSPELVIHLSSWASYYRALRTRMEHLDALVIRISIDTFQN